MSRRDVHSDSLEMSQNERPCDSFLDNKNRLKVEKTVDKLKRLNYTKTD